MKVRVAVLGCVLLLAAGCSGTTTAPVDTSELQGADESIPAHGEGAPIGCVAAQSLLATAAPLNLREGPSADASILLVLPEGAELSPASGASCPENGYYKVRFGGFEGWAYSAWLRMDMGTLESELSYANTRDDAIARAKASVGFSYWWGHGRFLESGSTGGTAGSCSGSCPSCSHSGSYGGDCSGLAAKAWVVPSSNDSLSTDSHPYSTYNFDTEYHGWHNVSRGSAQKADAMVYNVDGAGHIFIYEKGDPWGSMYAYECKGCSDGCVYNLRTAGSSYKAIGRDNMISSTRKSADIATFYAKSSGGAAVHTWKSSTNSYTYSGGNGWWDVDSGYSLSNVGDRMVSGDFNGDGKADVAVFYDYGSGAARLHVYTSTGSALSYSGPSGWWSVDSGYSLSSVGDRMVSGDFNGDGKADIAVFYDYGSGAARIHVWLSTGSSFTYQGQYGWWSVDSGYTLSSVGGRMVAGDFNNDGKDDIATFYDYGSGAARVHVWRSTGSAFTYQDATGWWSVDSGYILSNVSGRMVAGDFNNDGKDDIATFYAYGSGAARVHVWLSTGSALSYSGPSGWWSVDSGYSLTSIGNRMVAGDFNKDGRADIATFYNYGGSASRLHVFTSTGSALSYSGSSGWWSVDSGYDLDFVSGRIVVGNFDGL